MARGRKVANGSALMPIELDPSFVRVFADQTLVMHLGRDIDISMLAIGPRLERIQRGRTDVENDVMHMRPQLNEMARVRLNPNSAAVMAMEILQGLIKSGVADKAGVIEALEQIEEPEARRSEGDESVSEEIPFSAQSDQGGNDEDA